MNTRKRPDRQWYERMISKTLDDDFVIGPSAFAASSSETNVSPLTVAFGVLVSLARRSKTLSVNQLAGKLSVEADEIQQIEHNPAYSARPRTISKIASFFDLPMAELMKLAGAAVSNDETFRTKAMKFAAHSDDMSTLTSEEQEMLKSFIRFLRERP